MKKKITVILADDHPLLVHGLISLLEKRENIEVLGHAHDGLTALNLIKECNPDVAVLDVQKNLRPLHGLSDLDTS